MKCNFNKVDVTLSHNYFPGKCLDNISAFFLKPQQKNLHEQNSTEWKTASSDAADFDVFFIKCVK